MELYSVTPPISFTRKSWTCKKIVLKKELNTRLKPYINYTGFNVDVEIFEMDILGLSIVKVVCIDKSPHWVHTSNSKFQIPISLLPNGVNLCEIYF